MAILGQAFSLVWGTCVQCRMGCEVRSHHGNQRIALVDPGSDRCGIIVVTSLATLLQANRGSRLVTLQLGLATQHPASLVVEAPVILKAPLYDLIHSADPALRLIPLEGSTDPGLSQPHIVIGPLSRRWLSRSSRSQDRVIQLSHIQNVTARLASQGYSAFFVSRPGEPPFALYITCPNLQAAVGLVVALRDNPDVSGQFETILGIRPQAVFEASVLPECITLGEKSLRKLLKPPGDGSQPPHARV